MCFQEMGHDIDEYLLISSLNSLSQTSSPISIENNIMTWCLDLKLVARSVARKLFRSRFIETRDVRSNTILYYLIIIIYIIIIFI